MAEHPIKDLMETTMEKIKNMVDVNTIIGNPISLENGTTIIPISTVNYGFAAGGSDFPSKKTTDDKSFFGGGSGAGITIKPVAFLCVSASGDVRMINTESPDNTTERVAEMIPGVVEKITKAFKEKKEEKKKEKEMEKSDIVDPELE